MMEKGNWALCKEELQPILIPPLHIHKTIECVMLVGLRAIGPKELARAVENAKAITHVVEDPKDNPVVVKV